MPWAAGSDMGSVGHGVKTWGQTPLALTSSESMLRDKGV